MPVSKKEKRSLTWQRQIAGIAQQRPSAAQGQQLCSGATPEHAHSDSVLQRGGAAQVSVAADVCLFTRQSENQDP